MRQEIWKAVQGYNGAYKVSNLGRVWSCKTGQFLKPSKNENGYCKVTLYQKREGKQCYIHRLVAQAFLPNPENLPQVNHIDQNKENNAMDNLEWCTSEYNNNYGDRSERVAKALSHKVYQYDKQGNFIAEWDSMTEAQEKTGVDKSSISKACVGKLKTAGGYKWSCEAPEEMSLSEVA